MSIKTLKTVGIQIKSTSNILYLQRMNCSKRRMSIHMTRINFTIRKFIQVGIGTYFAAFIVGV